LARSSKLDSAVEFAMVQSFRSSPIDIRRCS
jgi:hypothetical protein